jgi:uncharacterized protein YPO0396
MNDLEEKAKTAWQIKMEMENLAKEIFIPEIRTEALEKWVLVSVAQQEIDKARNEQRIKDAGILQKHIDEDHVEWARERGLQKQKLQQFEEFLVSWIENDIETKKTHYYPSQDLDLVLDFFFGFKELLK